MAIKSIHIIHTHPESSPLSEADVTSGNVSFLNLHQRIFGHMDTAEQPELYQYAMAKKGDEIDPDRLLELIGQENPDINSVTTKGGLYYFRNEINHFLALYWRPSKRPINNDFWMGVKENTFAITRTGLFWMETVAINSPLVLSHSAISNSGEKFLA